MNSKNKIHCKDENIIDKFYDRLPHFCFSNEMITYFGIMCYSLRYRNIIGIDNF